jgi:hypothetical protein
MLPHPLGRQDLVHGPIFGKNLKMIENNIKKNVNGDLDRQKTTHLPDSFGKFYRNLVPVLEKS